MGHHGTWFVTWCLDSTLNYSGRVISICFEEDSVCINEDFSTKLLLSSLCLTCVERAPRAIFCFSISRTRNYNMLLQPNLFELAHGARPLSSTIALQYS